MMITIYLYGCSTCGVNAVYVRRVKAYAQEHNQTVEVRNSKYDVDARQIHVEYLESMFGRVSDYIPIVIDENGNATELRKWIS
jgi:hypothetical protein